MSEIERQAIWHRIYKLEDELEKLKADVKEPTSLKKFDYGGSHGRYKADRLKEAAAALTDGMIWSATPEGSNFWRAIFIRLETLGRGGKPQDRLEVIL